MKRSNRIAALVLAVLLVISTLVLSSCQETKKEHYSIGICQFAQHEALDAATQGFKDAVVKGLGEENVEFDMQNASGNNDLCTSIANSFVNKNVDLIMCNATPAVQAAYNATTTIPILGTSVTEYSVALKLENYNGTVGGNVSGTSDLAPLDEQAKVLAEFYPDAKTVGLLYCGAEDNSEYQVKVMEEELAKLGYETTRFSFADSNDVSTVTAAACAKVDVIYIPTDNTAASCAETIGNIVLQNNTPIIACEASTCSHCGVATLSISYYDLGYKTGEMAVKILKGEANISEMPIEYAGVSKYYNAEICEALNITPPEGYEALA